MLPTHHTGACLLACLPACSTGDPLAVALVVCLLLGALCFTLSIPTNNHSWVRQRCGGTGMHRRLSLHACPTMRHHGPGIPAVLSSEYTPPHPLASTG